MRDLLTGADYVPLAVESYFADFWERFEHLDGVLWKLERRQDFREPGYPSWDAFAAGRVNESLALIEESREELTDYHHKLTGRGVVSRRVRVVADPPTPYLWWESHVLKLRAEAGEQMRTVDVASVAQHEADGWTLPEVVILGSEAMYDVQYDAEGVITGAHRYQQQPLIETWLGFIAGLFDAGDPFLDYYWRSIESQAPPQILRD
jgi:hypothetical protein